MPQATRRGPSQWTRFADSGIVVSDTNVAITLKETRFAPSGGFKARLVAGRRDSQYGAYVPPMAGAYQARGRASTAVMRCCRDGSSTIGITSSRTTLATYYGVTRR